MKIVRQFFISNGNLFSYSEYLDKFGFPVTPKEYAVVFDTIPQQVIHFVRACGDSSEAIC